MTWWAWLLVTFGAFWFGFILAACLAAAGANRQCEECAAQRELAEFLAEKAERVPFYYREKGETEWHEQVLT